MTDIDPTEQAKALLRAEGYLVVRVPPCDKEGQDHGSHILITRSARCPGGGTVPHGLHSRFQGTFGPWVNCCCENIHIWHRTVTVSPWSEDRS